jgi:hypothetical protein
MNLNHKTKKLLRGRLITYFRISLKGGLSSNSIRLSSSYWKNREFKKKEEENESSQRTFNNWMHEMLKLNTLFIEGDPPKGINKFK